MALAQDDRLKVRVQQALKADQGLSGLTFSVHVFMERAYIVGYVDSHNQAKVVFEAAKKVHGLRSVEAHLPRKESARNDSAPATTTSETSVKTKIKSALALTPEVVSRVHVEVLDNHAVLLGVVSGSKEKNCAATAAALVDEVKDVTNWLLLPEKGYMSTRQQ